jgi:nucleoid DNA-binding protein
VFQHISTLLFRHDCVILPGFGSFVGNVTCSEKRQDKNILVPPHKKIAFNQSIKNNDGLLANFIAAGENLSYLEANKKITEFVSFLEAELKKNGKVSFPDIGTLRLDAEKNLVFEPADKVNYLRSSYGLPPLTYPPLLKRDVREEETAVLPETRPIKKFRWRRAAVLIPAVAAAGILSFGSLNKGSLSYSFINPFAGFFKKKDIPVTVSITPKAPAPALKPALIPGTSPENARYFIIAGCYANYENARKALEELRSRGYDASLGGMRKGLHVVCYRGYTSRQEALNDLLVIQDNEDITAWVMKK